MNVTKSAGVTVQSRYVTCLGREIHALDWAPEGEARGDVLAWHGLARTGRDFDELAGALSQSGWRVICPDTLGRGYSQWAAEPRQEYCLQAYVRTAAALLDGLGISSVHWVGTSMGGAIGTVFASGVIDPVLAERVLSLTLNDNAPRLAAAAIERIKAYAGQPPAFATMLELEAFFRQVYRPFGALTDAQWRRLAQTSSRRLPTGQWTVHYDPAIVQQFFQHPDDYDLWSHWDRVQAPVLCLRGAESDLVLPETVHEMCTRGPGAHGRLTVIEVPGCGHAPALNTPEQMAWIQDFIASHAVPVRVAR